MNPRQKILACLLEAVTVSVCFSVVAGPEPAVASAAALAAVAGAVAPSAVAVEWFVGAADRRGFGFSAVGPVASQEADRSIYVLAVGPLLPALSHSAAAQESGRFLDHFQSKVPLGERLVVSVPSQFD